MAIETLSPDFLSALWICRDHGIAFGRRLSARNYYWRTEPCKDVPVREWTGPYLSLEDAVASCMEHCGFEAEPKPG